ncbi:hypothetical protein CALVIDRAFT_603623 [Calocera viscosa TUFC12733]|uniref:Uncharacterized protein n=1 Tax=Calocera viscosa (strain TUFC12733) TaxID=1330018 RepID=A0A167FEW2_CALVF|nr:hypothetical protein CALVIDRAFT_569934 [Calocera viscosa TUFC12733]KZO89423.1 hypothetical protein CALVIDRAFT_603623 [Calocera viscosa TUFC12733]
MSNQMPERRSTARARTPRLRQQPSYDIFSSSAILPLLPAPLKQDELAEDDGEEGEVEVHGIAGRIRLSHNPASLPARGFPARHDIASAQKVPSLPGVGAAPPMGTIFKWALWPAWECEDIQAYEYLCRIPEWEEKMRDGFVLAKLVEE